VLLRATAADVGRRRASRADDDRRIVALAVAPWDETLIAFAASDGVVRLARLDNANASGRGAAGDRGARRLGVV
jgi:hypothetical protein